MTEYVAPSETVSTEALQRYVLNELYSTVDKNEPLQQQYDTAVVQARDYLTTIFQDAAVAHNDVFDPSIVDNMLTKIMSDFLLPTVERLVLVNQNILISSVLKKLDSQTPAGDFFNHVVQISDACVLEFVLDKTKHMFHLNYENIQSLGTFAVKVIKFIAVESVNKYFEAQALMFRL